MSMSKLESLPNEILTELFEKYMNGVDVLAGFANSQNSRFDALILQCRRLNLNFRHCRKDHFRACLDRLPICLIEKIEELVLSEQDTPGQITDFLTFSPTFTAFKQLRKLHIHVNAPHADWPAIILAVESLSKTSIATFSIEIINAGIDSTLHNTINEIISLQTMKRLSFTSDAPSHLWLPLSAGSSTLEYLKYFDMTCGFEHLPYIFRFGSHLKYLNLQLSSDSYLGYHHVLDPLRENIKPMPNLRTLILSFMRADPTTFIRLAEYLKLMPALDRLEIKAHSSLLNANAWESLLQTSLPLLTHFRLKSTISRVQKDQLDTILASFETPFWIEMTNFYLIITEHRKSFSHRFYLNQSLTDYEDEFCHPVVRWWIVPTRARIDDIPTNDIMNFGITNAFESLSDYHYFRNVKHLAVYNLDWGLVERLSMCTNYRGIEHLDVSPLDSKSSSITLLLPYLKNISSLRIQYEHLLTYQKAYSEQLICLKHLDISVNNHSFAEKDIITISKLFPNLEHLAINTEELSNVPLLKTYLPALCSLTFSIMDRTFSSHLDRRAIWDTSFRQQVRFLCHRNDQWLTIWMDQAAFEDPYWQTFHSSS